MEIKKTILTICLILLCLLSGTYYVKASGIRISAVNTAEVQQVHNSALVLTGDKTKGSAAKENTKPAANKNNEKSKPKNKTEDNFINKFFKSMNNKKLIIIIIIAIAVIMLIITALLFLRKKGKPEKDMIPEIKKSPDVPPLSFGNAQNIGRREDQQDSFGISDCSDEKLVKEKGVFAIVADGMGGLDNGKESSSLVVDSMMKYFTEKPFISAVPIELRNMLVSANSQLLQHLAQKGSVRSGSTAVSVIIKDNELYWISIGDSRIYLFRNKKIYTLNRDHVYGAELLQKAIDGEISFDEVLTHPDRKALTSYMGISEITEIDQNIKPFRLLPGDKIVLCSDGVYGSLEENELIEALKSDAQNAAFELEQKVLAKNIRGQDNMTAVIIGYKKETNLC